MTESDLLLFLKHIVICLHMKCYLRWMDLQCETREESVDSRAFPGLCPGSPFALMGHDDALLSATFVGTDQGHAVQ